MDLYEVQKANPEIFQQFSMKDTLFLYYSCPQRDRILQLYAKHSQFTFTLSGERLFSHGNQTLVSDSRKGMLIKRTAFLQELPPDYEGWDVLVFYLKDDYLRSIFDEFRPHLKLNDLPEADPSMMCTFVINDQTRNCYNSIIPYFGKDKKMPDSILEGKFKELLFNIFSHPKNKQILSYIMQIIDGYPTPIWEVMEANYMYDLRIQDFANISNRSLSAFKRDFKQYYKMPPGKWITERRLKRAKSLLETTSKSISEVVFESGFNNASHFSRVFRERFHISPSVAQKV
ncbi:helix-turn-helix transcriptional regulator [Cyclobacterium sp. 1_MG-2023]|uniref:helix-turn-helix domain-containing protein n=1 Tax=Cyclobacterium sp. 1_MG-2023 TaxID=3062681 RepID=UPI0026E1FC42|nr:helix-turn-helix transcriptional regulator [Cyclobacterium sp. 1_MG-2023]MDO6436646.1 helix-turn-helix transcriptional regulator [Cyclobacterium sp. 1_MG-2023]